MHPTPTTAPDPTPLPARVRELGWHAAAVAVTLVVLVGGLRLDRADFHAPFAYEYDALLILPFVKEVVEKGHHWRTDRLGAPGVQHLHDFPVVDHLHFTVVWLLGRVFPDPVVVFNLYYLLTYPLAAVTALFALRRLGLSPPAAILCALLYTFQPYHYLRGQVHYFLAAYYVVPLTLLVTLDICRGRLPFFEPVSPGVYRRRLKAWPVGGAAAVGLATASAGAYYAFFGCLFLAAAGAYGWAATRTWRAAASASVMVGIVVAGGVLNHAPAFAYQAEVGPNGRPRERQAEEAELYGLKIAQLVLPVAGHNPVAVGETILVDPAAVRSMYQAPQFKELNESDWDPLGLLGAVGYVALLASVCLPGRRGWPVGPLAALTVAGTLFGTLGGFGAVFNLLVSAQVRCYNRISIYLAFLALAAAGWGFDRLFHWLTAGRPAAVHMRWPGCLLVLVFGLWDQTNDQWFSDFRTARPGYVSLEGQRRSAARRYAADAEFFGRVEALLPAGMVFTYPYIEFPEARPYSDSGAPGKTDAYEMTTGYLHTKELRWSFGTMKGREWDAWMRGVSGGADRAVPKFLGRITAAGFEGLLVDARGLSPRHRSDLQGGLDQVLGRSALREVHPDRKLYFYDLREYRESVRRAAPAAFEAQAAAERESLVVLWMDGFHSYEPPGYEDRIHWCGRAGRMTVVNRAAAPVTVTLRMKFRTAFKGTGRLEIASGLAGPDGSPFAADLVISPADKPDEHVWPVVVPPGRHAVTFRFVPDVNVPPTDSRRLLFTVRDFKAD